MVREFCPLLENNEVTEREYTLLRAFLEKKTGKLWDHEVNVQIEKGLDPPNGYQASFSPLDMASYESLSGPNFYLAWGSEFGKLIFGNGYYNAYLHNPFMFGTGNADDVLSALFASLNKEGSNIFNWEAKQYTDYLQKEECCYVVKKEEDSFSGDILRIDLFRMVRPKKETPSANEFIGGLFHVLDHFAINGKNLSTGSDTYNVQSIQEVVKYCIEAFVDPEEKNEKEVEGRIQLDDYHILKIVFYKENESGVFFIKTAYPIRIKE